MSNVLAALFGGLGAGARSYGTDLTREQDQNRLAQQRMAELQQQEQARLAQIREMENQRRLTRDEEQMDMTAAMQALGVQVPQGARLTRETTPLIVQQSREKEAEARRLRSNKATYNAARQAGRIPETVEYSDDVNFLEMLRDGRIEDAQGNARAMQSTALAARAAADAARAAANAGRQQSGLGDRMAMQLSTQYERAMEPRRKAYDDISNALSVRDAALKGDGGAQMQMLYGFITSLDPASTVREGEVALAKQAAPLIARAQSAATALAQNKSALVTPEFINQVSALMDARRQSILNRAEQERKNYLGRAGRFNVGDPDALFPSVAPPSRPNLNRY